MCASKIYGPTNRPSDSATYWVSGTRPKCIFLHSSFLSRSSTFSIVALPPRRFVITSVLPSRVFSNLRSNRSLYPVPLPLPPRLSPFSSKTLCLPIRKSGVSSVLESWECGTSSMDWSRLVAFYNKFSDLKSLRILDSHDQTHKDLELIFGFQNRMILSRRKTFPK